MSLTHLVIWRHGETDWNAEKRMQGHRDLPLNDTGRAQVIAAAPSVAAFGPQVIVSSDLRRAVDTAAAAAALTGLPVTTDPRLRETSLGLWEGLTRAEVVAGWPGEWERWRTTSAHAAPPRGESRFQVAERSARVVAELDETAVQRALLVAHGGLIVGLTGLLLGLPDDRWSTLVGVGNCHWVVLHRTFGAWRLHSYNAGLAGLVVTSGWDADDEVPGA